MQLIPNDGPHEDTCGVTCVWQGEKRSRKEEHYYSHYGGQSKTICIYSSRQKVREVQRTHTSTDAVSESGHSFCENIHDMDGYFKSWSITTSTSDVDMFRYDAQPMLCRLSTSVLLIENSAPSPPCARLVGIDHTAPQQEPQSTYQCTDSFSQSITPCFPYNSRST